jgi:hypothetical protein
MQVSVIFSSGGHRLTRMDFMILDQLDHRSTLLGVPFAARQSK